VFVTEEDALGELEFVFSAPPPVVWEYFTDPQKRLEWQLGLTSIDENVDGRRGVDTVSHCAHGSGTNIQRVVDWRPFSSFTTVDETEGAPVVLTFTNDFTPVDEGTAVTLRLLTDPPEMWPTIADDTLAVLGEAAEVLEGLLVDQVTGATAP
jgi:uncharacterized protein YndB with AHSA1/START domain